MNKIEQYTQKAIAIANDNKHGYSQYNRWGNPDYDCSSLVITVVEKSGVPVKTNGATYTGNMYKAFLKSGFKDVTNTTNLRNGSGLKRGDILLNVKHHTEIYIGNNKTVGARRDERGGIVGAKKGDNDGKEIRVGYYYNYPWTHVLRYYDDSQTTTIKAQEAKKALKDTKFIKYENWAGVTKAVCNVRSAPNTRAEVVAQYGVGQKINYDSVYESDGYRWISYIGGSGVRRYVAYRRLSGDTRPWIRF